MKNISIAYITDNKFCLLTRTSINSVIQNCNSCYKYNIYIICVNVYESEKKIFKELETSNVTINIVETNNLYEDVGQKTFRVSKAALFKFQLSNLISEENKVLYLDGDTIIQSDLVNFFNTDIHNKYAAVVKDWYGEIQNKDHLRLKHKNYFNSGVMLLNLEKMRQDEIPNKLLEWKINDKWQKYMDQDALNAVFDENVIYVSEKYNFHNIYYDYREENEKYAPLKAIHNIEIFHFTDKKPDMYTNIARKEIFYRYVLPRDINLITFNYIHYMIYDTLNGKFRDALKELNSTKENIISEICHFIASNTNQAKGVFFVKHKGNSTIFSFLGIPLFNKNKKNGIKRYYILGIEILKITKKTNEKKFNVLGIPVYEKILKNKEYKTIKLEIPAQNSSVIPSNIIRIAIFESGGLGDTILSTNFLKELYLQSNDNIEVDCFYRNKSILNGMSFIRHIFDYNCNIEKYYNKYDIIFTVNRFFMVKHLNKEKVQKLHPQLYKYCTQSQELEKIFSSNLNPRNFGQWSLMQGRNRYEQMSIADFPQYNRLSKPFMPININVEKTLEKFNLNNIKYITLSHSVDGIYNANHPKLWPLDYFERLILQIKKIHPNIQFVQLGSNQEFGIIKNADINLVEKTNFEELKVVLKHSVLHIDSEGGLVHLKYALNGVSVVIFGPTEPGIFAYDKNINFLPQECGGCCWMSSSWSKKCLKGYEVPACMCSTSPKDVTEKVCNYLEKLQSYKLQIINDQNNIKNLYFTGTILILNNLPDKLKPHIKKAQLLTTNIRLLKAQISEFITLNYGDPENIPSDDNSVDCIVCGIENISQSVLSEMMRVVKVNGLIWYDGIVYKKINNQERIA